MINACNQEIDNFLTSIPDIGEKDLNAIRTKYSSNITDVIVKGHITSNVCMKSKRFIRRTC